MGLISIPVHSILWQRGAGGPLDQRSRALGFRAVSGRAQSHLTCSGAHDVRINAVGSLFRTAADGRLVLDWSQDQLQDPWGKVNVTAKPLFRASFLVGLTGFEPATT